MPYLQPTLHLPPTLSFHQKTILITGASSGIGLACAKLLLHHGVSHIIFGVRTPSTSSALKSTILSSSTLQATNPTAKITILHLDNTSYASVLTFANEVKEKFQDEGLDMLVLNAGTGSLKREVVGEKNHEKMVQVNLLSHALLALELLPLLKQTAERRGTPSRLCWVGSFVQFDHTLTANPPSLSVSDSNSNTRARTSILKHFDDPKSFDAMGRYADSKLLSTMFVQRLASVVDKEKVIVNEVSPGMVRTGFGEYPAWLRLVFGALFALKARSVEGGAKTYLYALGVAGGETHGEYLSDNVVTRRAPFVFTEEGKKIGDMLWGEILEECRSVDPMLELPKRAV